MSSEDSLTQPGMDFMSRSIAESSKDLGIPSSITERSLSSGNSYSGRITFGSLPGNYTGSKMHAGGLGLRYYDTLGLNLDKILQVDIVSGVTESRGSVRGRALKLAAEMQALGISHNDIVMIYSSSQADQTVAVLGILFLGAIVAPLDPEFSSQHSLALMSKLKPKLLFTDNRSFTNVIRNLDKTNTNPIIINFDSHDSVFYKSFQHLIAGRSSARFKPKHIEDINNTVAFIFPTQGTTGQPKLVCCSHQYIHLQTLILRDIFGTDTEKIISFFPLSWFLQGVLVCMCFEECITRIIPGTFSERSACKYIQDFKITSALFGTDLARKVLRGPAAKDFTLSSLTSVLIGSTNTTRKSLEVLRDCMPHVKFLQCYCLTETGVIAAMNSQNYDKARHKNGTVGQLVSNCKVKILDLDTRHRMGSHTIGQIFYKGDGMMIGYFGAERRRPLGYKSDSSEFTQPVIDIVRKNVFNTGDLGLFDEEGWLYFAGRIEDLILYQSINFNTCELEECIIAHPKVMDVIVIGNERDIVAVVKKMEDCDLSAKQLFNYIAHKWKYYPQPTKIILLESYPKTSIGNVKKYVLREAYLEVKIKYVTSIASIE